MLSRVTIYWSLSHIYSCLCRALAHCCFFSRACLLVSCFASEAHCLMSRARALFGISLDRFYMCMLRLLPISVYCLVPVAAFFASYLLQYTQSSTPRVIVQSIRISHTALGLSRSGMMHNVVPVRETIPALLAPLGNSTYLVYWTHCRNKDILQWISVSVVTRGIARCQRILLGYPAWAGRRDSAYYQRGLYELELIIFVKYIAMT